MHSYVDGHLGCFRVLSIVNCAAMNTEIHVSFQIRVFVFSGYMPRSRIVESLVTQFLFFFKELDILFFFSHQSWSSSPSL